MKVSKITLRQALATVRKDKDLLDLGGFLLAGGHNKEQVIAVLAEALDDRIDFTALVAGAAGVALEQADRAMFKAALWLSWNLIEAAAKRFRERAV